MVASRLYIIISMISASFMAPQLLGNIFLVLISKPVRICFANANRMIQVRSIIMKNSIKKVPYVALKKDCNGTYGWKEVMALCPWTCMTPFCPSILVTVALLEWEIPSSFSIPASYSLLSPQTRSPLSPQPRRTGNQCNCVYLQRTWLTGLLESQSTEIFKQETKKMVKQLNTRAHVWLDALPLACLSVWSWVKNTSQLWVQTSLS